MKLFAGKFRHILDIFTWWGLRRKFWAHFHDFCIQKWSCFLQSSDAFRRFPPCEVNNRISGRIITIFAYTNKAVCHEVQTDFGSFLRTSFIEKFMTHHLDFCVQKRTCMLLSSDTFWKFSPYEVYEKSSGCIFKIYASINEAVFCEVQTDFGSSLPARFTEKVDSTISPFMPPKMKLFTVKVRCILEVFALQG